MMTISEPRQWESRLSLLDHLNGLAVPTVVVGAEAESARHYYSVHLLAAAGHEMEVGIIASGHGIRPSCMGFPGTTIVAIGHDTSVSVVDAWFHRIVRIVSLDGVFYRFLGTGRMSDLVVWHELGAVRLDRHGNAVWSVSTDVLARCTPNALGQLVLEEMDSGLQTLVDIETGAKSVMVRR
jgi:hypothetical protein